MSGPLKKLVIALAGVAGMVGGVAHADAPILKTTGYLRFTPLTPLPFTSSVNYFDPANGYVPAGTSNSAGITVPIDANVEFGFDDGINLDTVDFINGTSLLIKDISTNGASPFRFTVFTNRNHFFDNATFALNEFNGVFRVNSRGNGLTFVSPNLIPSGGSTRVASITFLGVGAATPEPASWAMMVMGFGAIGAAMRLARTRVMPRLAYSR